MLRKKFALLMSVIMLVTCFTVMPVSAANDKLFKYGDVEYATFTDVLNAAFASSDSATIEILGNATYAGYLELVNKKLVLDLNGYTFTVANGNSEGPGVLLDSSSLSMKDEGKLNIKGHYGIIATASDVTVSNVTGDYIAIDAAGASKVTVKSDVTVVDGIAGVGAYEGSVIFVGGNVSGKTSQYSGVEAVDMGSKITVVGDVLGASMRYGASAFAGATIIVNGNVSGMENAAYAEENASVVVGGNAVSGGSGAKVNSGGTVTVTGKVTAAAGIVIDGMVYGESNFVRPTTKSGYRTYTDGVSTIWLKSMPVVIEGNSGSKPTATSTDVKNSGSSYSRGGGGSANINGLVADGILVKPVVKPVAPKEVLLQLTIGSDSYKVKGKETTFKEDLGAPYISKEGNTMIPVKAVIVSLGLNIEWKAKTKEITVTLQNGDRVQLQVGSSEIKKNGEVISYLTDAKGKMTAPVIVNGRTYLPLKAFFTGVLGYDADRVKYDAATKQITILSK